MARALKCQLMLKLEKIEKLKNLKNPVVRLIFLVKFGWVSLMFKFVSEKVCEFNFDIIIRYTFLYS